jgi:hypothetical protein
MTKHPVVPLLVSECFLVVVPSQSCSKGYVLKRFREAKVLLVDEVSMLSPTLLEVSRPYQHVLLCTRAKA